MRSCGARGKEPSLGEGGTGDGGDLGFYQHLCRLGAQLALGHPRPTARPSSEVERTSTQAAQVHASRAIKGQHNAPEFALWPIGPPVHPVVALPPVFVNRPCLCHPAADTLTVSNRSSGALFSFGCDPGNG